ncbi:MAG: hypothetical protein ACYDBV_03120 [Nitrospiria bacterium]
MRFKEGYFLFLYVVLISGCGAFGSGNDIAPGGPPAPFGITVTPVILRPGDIAVNWVTQPGPINTPNSNILYVSTNPNVSPTRYEIKKMYINPPTIITGLKSGATYYFVMTTITYQNIEGPPSSPAISAIAP